MDAPSSSLERNPAFATLLDRLRRGEPAALARCLTLAEQGGALADTISRAIYPATGRSAVVGFSGPPGAGKSTLIDAYVTHLRAAGRSVAIAAVDPSSPISGGSVLGDRVRMHARPFPASSSAPSPRAVISAVFPRAFISSSTNAASGRDVIVIETVGAGQSEGEIVEVANVCVVVNAPGLGDDVQAIKSGILEIADVLVVNKADLLGSPLPPTSCAPCWRCGSKIAVHVPVIETIATIGAGIDALSAAMDAGGARTPTQKRANRLRRSAALSRNPLAVGSGTGFWRSTTPRPTRYCRPRCAERSALPRPPVACCATSRERRQNRSAGARISIA